MTRLTPASEEDDADACDPCLYDPALFSPAPSLPASPLQSTFSHCSLSDRDKVGSTCLICCPMVSAAHRNVLGPCLCCRGLVSFPGVFLVCDGGIAHLSEPVKVPPPPIFGVIGALRP